MKRVLAAMALTVGILANGTAPAAAMGAVTGLAIVDMPALIITPNPVYVVIFGTGVVNGRVGDLHCQFSGTETSANGVFRSQVDGNCGGVAYYLCNNLDWVRVGTVITIDGQCDDQLGPVDSRLHAVVAFEPIVVWPSTYAGVGTITLDEITITCGSC